MGEGLQHVLGDDVPGDRSAPTMSVVNQSATARIAMRSGPIKRANRSMGLHCAVANAMLLRMARVFGVISPTTRRIGTMMNSKMLP